MKSIHKRVFALVIALVIVAGLAACGGSGDQSGGTGGGTPAPASNNNSGAAAPAPVADGPLTPYAEPVTITWAVQASQVQKFFDGDTYEDNRWSRKIKEDLNIDLEVYFSADISTDAFRNRINVALASGDLPDIFNWSDRTWFTQAYEAGYLYDMTDLYAQYATDNVKAYQDKWPGGFKGASIDGRLYAFPSMVDNFHQAVYLWIRDDWLEKAGGKPPQTVDEMVEMARILTSGDGSTYGFALNNKFDESNFGNIAGLASAFGAPVRGQDVYYRGSDGKMQFGWIQPGVKDALAVVRDMYAEGLIDPEFVVKDGGTLEVDVANGKVGMMYHMNWGTWYPYNFVYESEGVITRPYPIPTQAGHDFKVGINSNESPEYMFMLNANTKHPEAFMKILNLYEATVESSDKADNFQDFWADEQYRLCPVFVPIPTELYADVLHPALAANDRDSLATGVQVYYDWIKNFEAGTDTNPNAYGTWGQMFERGSMAVALYDYSGHIVQSVMSTERPEIWYQNSSILEGILRTTFTDIITGAKPLDAFDEAVADWLANGGQQTLDELEVMYP
ncbi:MAG: extracellular solute-binding protein [Oscillospiraceae bacterium]|nr:extracellular solute-binding protein [Oscillospiraceae bacterium]